MFVVRAVKYHEKVGGGKVKTLQLAMTKARRVACVHTLTRTHKRLL
jgi:hypothetical protein